MKMKKILSAVLAGVLCLTAMTACSSAQSLESIKKAGKITVYTNAAFMPFEYIKDGKPAGVDMDIAQAIADDIGVELEIKDVEFSSVLAAISSGKASFGASGLSVKPERQKEMDFSNPYVTTVQYIIVPEATEISVFEDLAGKNIGVQDGTTGYFYVSEAINGTDDEDTKEHTKGVLEGSGATVKPYTNAMAATQDMLAGRLDAVVIDKLPAEAIVKNNTGIKCLEMIYADGSKTTEQYALAVPKGSDELLKQINKTIDRLIEEGKIDEWLVAHSE